MKLVIIIVFIIIITTTNVFGTENLQKINKCCPLGECVSRRKMCVKTPFSENFSSKITVYTKDLYETGMAFEDVFNISDNKFGDKNFRRESLDLTYLNFITYITENGVLQLELPNAYERWLSFSPKDYCVDCRLLVRGRNNGKPRIWAVLPTIDDTDTNHSKQLKYATFISCFFLLLVLIVYMLLPELRNLSGVILMAYIISLFTAFLLLGLIQISYYDALGCICITMGIYFSFLACFCWMNIMAFDVWWTIRGYAKGRHIHRRGERFKFVMYCLYAFGIPLLMTIGLFLLNLYGPSMKHLPWFVTPHVPEYGCFLEGGVKLLYLYVPMLILILINCVFYLMTAYNVLRLRRKLVSISTIKCTGVNQAQLAHKQRFRDYLKISVMVGLNWILEVLSFYCPGAYWLVTDVYNALIGIVLFYIFVCNKKVLNSLCDRFKGKKTMSLPNVGYSCTTVNTIESETQPADSKK
nr:G-protein coupled receptor Mth2 [Helicoverpa armigera]